MALINSLRYMTKASTRTIFPVDEKNSYPQKEKNKHAHH